MERTSLTRLMAMGVIVLAQALSAGVGLAQAATTSEGGEPTVSSTLLHSHSDSWAYQQP
jgi:hypothetical protein